MSRLIESVDAVRKRVRMSFASGVDEQSFRDIPLLLSRIDELERALQPFARVGNTPTDTPLVHVYHKDCVNAAVMLTPLITIVPADIPAEG
jgi:hypothetical protein